MSSKPAAAVEALTAAQTTTTMSTGEVAAALAERLIDTDLIYAASDEVAAIAIAQALSAFVPEAAVICCPASDALPGDDAPASPANVGQRVSALRRLRRAIIAGEQRIALIATGEALGRAYPEPGSFDAAPPRIDVDAPLDLAALFATLEGIGYFADERVDEPGEAALRGNVLDVFPADAPQPLRVEAADGKIMSIRFYDPADQRTTSDCLGYELGQVAEPAVGEAPTSLLDHLPDAVVIVPEAADDRRRRLLALGSDIAKRGTGATVRDLIDDKQWRRALKARDAGSLDRVGDPPPRFVEERAPLKVFAATVAAARKEGNRVAILGSARDLRFLKPRLTKRLKLDIADVASWAALQNAGAGAVVAMAVAVESGFVREGIVAVAAADLLGSRAERLDAATATGDAGLFDVGEIRVGDVIVHEDHGIGVVAGLEPIPSIDGAESGDAIALDYADGGKRLVPVAEADRIWRYGADADAVTLDKLDGTSWIKRRGAIDAAIAESARGLTQLAEERAKREAPVLQPATAAYERFAAGFAYTETADQARAIEAVRSDLASGKPMDRLVIGDVGYGKTEVALRAAAIVALAGRQVAIAAPTTVLARQHLEVFTARFADSGIVVAGLSRLSSAADKKKVKAGLADGSVQVVIGTGAVAAKGIAYRDLGLVVVDEEQRFGAADKERLRSLGAGHTLTLSATPIPRTLQTALVGLQQLSVIATPPARRQPIRTAVAVFDPALVRAALLREKSRGGQSFVVVPRIEDMAALAEQLGKIVPELELRQAHGKMPAAEIDEAMVRFGRGDGDVLLATNIIEAGLDVPRANTMILWRADRFGLSQLHQLRGRVGRGSRRGQVLLLTAGDAEIAPRTLKRLRTLEAFDRLGAGFAIAARDLDMRGAGDLLGEAQAGHMKLIGIDLYQHLLEAALRAARGEKVERWTPELSLGIEGRLPASWIPDDEIRVTLYARLGRLQDLTAIDAFEAELEDRFGAVPDEARTLLTVARIRAGACAAKIARIDAGPAAIALSPRADATIDAEAAGLVASGERFLLAQRIADPVERLARVADLVDELA
ncbi:helicase-related protein [Sphingomonas sp. Tas61C01]|uniref:helicase-related protein n=1 Tax=Sphingomonas sp. Tas61C01 TaxID=3458297 RepID=UPI00403E3CAD